jgi:hypothetical protein
MSIYVARSPYRSSFSRAPKFRISFPNFSFLFAQRAAKRVRRQRPAVTHAAAPTTSLQGSVQRRIPGVSLKESFAKVKGAIVRFEFGPSTVIVGLMVIAVLFGFLYLAHFNQVATKGYDLRRLEADRQQLLNQYDIKNMKLAEVKSLNNIIQSNRISAMRKPAETIFVSGATALASVEKM